MPRFMSVSARYSGRTGSSIASAVAPSAASSPRMASWALGRSLRRRASSTSMTARYTSKTRRLAAGAAAARRRATCRWAAASSSRPWRMLSIASAAARFPSPRWASGGNIPQQRVERLAAAVHRQREVVVHEQARGRCPLTGCLMVADGFDDVAARCFVPGGRGAVQRRDRRRRDAPQLEAQQIGEQVVVAEPGAGGVERGDERVLVFEPLEDRLGSGAAGERIGQRAADALEDRRAQEQVAYLRRLALEHLGEEVARHGPLAAGELGHEALRVRVRGQRDRRQAQTGRPSLGAFVQRRPVRHPTG